MSQRQEGFNGGIPKGLSATSKSSRALEVIVRSHIDNIAEKHWRTGYSGKEIKKMMGVENDAIVSGSYPDGGVFLTSTGKPDVVFECKYQGETGNAIERVFKNIEVMRRLGTRKYVVFALGDGFFNSNSADRIMSLASNLYNGNETIWGTQSNQEDVFLEMYRYTDVLQASNEIPIVIDRLIIPPVPLSDTQH